MDEERKFWVAIWKIAAITLCAIIIAGLGSCQASKYQIRKAIEAGASPLETACAFEYGTASDNTLCAVEIMKR